MIIRKEMEMKKYMTPEMEVVDLKIQGILCASEPGGDQPGWSDEPADE
jgi:hypothetical protein